MRAIEFLTPELCKILAPKIRQSDRNEVLASHGLSDMERILNNARSFSHEAYAWIIDGEPIAAFGVAPGSYLQSFGIPWMLGTEEICGSNAINFLRNSKIIINYWLSRWDYLENYVDARNEISLRYLKFLGFVIDEPIPFGVQKLPFHRFYMKGDYHV